MSTEITPKRRAEIALAVGVNNAYLWQCLTGRKNMNPAEARRIEAETGGEITRKMLCQGTWQGIWPDLAEPKREAPVAADRPTAEPALWPLPAERRTDERREHPRNHSERRSR